MSARICRPMTVRDRILLIDRISSLGLSPDPNPQRCEYFFDPTMDTDNGVLGKFYPPNRILLPAWSEGLVAGDIAMLPTVVHELTHARQYRRLGRFRWGLANIPIIREWTIEPEAEDCEYAARVKLNLEAAETGED